MNFVFLLPIYDLIIYWKQKIYFCFLKINQCEKMPMRKKVDIDRRQRQEREGIYRDLWLLGGTDGHW